MKRATKQEKRTRRHKRVRAKISGTAEIPRLCVFRSNKHIYAQLIDDEKGKTLAAAGDLELEKSKIKNKKSKTKIKNEKAEETKKILKGKSAVAYKVGQLIAQKALNLSAGRHGKKIKKVVFDRGGYKYHGRIKALAEGAREKGLKF